MSGLPDGVRGRTNGNDFSPSSLDPLNKFRKGSKVYRIVEFLLGSGLAHKPGDISRKLMKKFPDLFDGEYKDECATVRRTCYRLAHTYDPPVLIHNAITGFYSCIDALYEQEVRFLAQSIHLYNLFLMIHVRFVAFWD